jgi:hypothetical protein
MRFPFPKSLPMNQRGDLSEFIPIRFSRRFIISGTSAVLRRGDAYVRTFSSGVAPGNRDRMITRSFVSSLCSLPCGLHTLRALPRMRIEGRNPTGTNPNLGLMILRKV